MSLRSVFKEYGLALGFVAVSIPLWAQSDIPFLSLVNELVSRIALDGLAVLALLPPLMVGAGFNFATRIGAWSTLIGFLVAASCGLSGMPGSAAALLVGLILGALLGGLIGWALGKMPGYEMLMTLLMVPLSLFPLKLLTEALVTMLPPIPTEATKYSAFGFHIVDLQPIQHAIELPWTLGPITLPIGPLLMLGLGGYIVNQFQKVHGMGSHPGSAEGRPPSGPCTMAFGLSFLLVSASQFHRFQSLSHVNVSLTAAGQTFPIIPALIVGGALLHRARVRHAVIGMLAWNLLHIPAAKVLTGLVFFETLMIVVSQGVILYALTRDWDKLIPRQTDPQPSS